MRDELVKPSGISKAAFGVSKKPVFENSFVPNLARDRLNVAFSTANRLDSAVAGFDWSPGFTKAVPFPTHPPLQYFRRTSPHRPRSRHVAKHAPNPQDTDMEDRPTSSDEATAGESSSSEESTDSEQRKRAIVNNVMRFFVRWLDGRLGTITRGSGSSNASGPALAGNFTGWAGAGPSQARGARKHGREEHGGEDSDEDGATSPPTKKRKDEGDDAEKMKLACPYFKHNPRKYKHQRPCCGPGWDFVHRIK